MRIYPDDLRCSFSLEQFWLPILLLTTEKKRNKMKLPDLSRKKKIAKPFGTAAGIWRTSSYDILKISLVGCNSTISSITNSSLIKNVVFKVFCFKWLALNFYLNSLKEVLTALKEVTQSLLSLTFIPIPYHWA